MRSSAPQPAVTDMVEYYRRRAQEYERIYAKPERQADLAQLHTLVRETFAGHRVLEVSCGTGYWTQSIAPTARSVAACDINPEVLAIARAKNWDAADVAFTPADSYALPKFPAPFTAAFSGFWWSHIPRERLRSFLDGLHATLEPRATVMFIDSRYVEGSSTPISRIDATGDSFQRRQLDDGSVYEVLKNFPSDAELLETVVPIADSPRILLTSYFWALTYHTR